MNLTIGADPELFLQTIQGKMISAVGRIGGSKEKPLPLPVEGCAIQEDNVSAEFNIPPCASLLEFQRHIKYVVSYLDDKAQEMGLLLARHVASHSFDPDQLESWQSQVFGCEPDLNVWTGRENPRPYSPDYNLRSCGGHVHVGTDLDPNLVIRSMDLHLGVPSISLDEDIHRRELYGKAGSYRRKPYGAEYRTLSNFWIWSDELIEWAWEGTNKAVEFVRKGTIIPRAIAKHIQKTINENDKNSQAICLEFLHG